MSVNLQFKIEGVSPLLMHSDSGVDVDSPLSKAISSITSKQASKKTVEDREEIKRLEWLQGVYLDSENNIVLPMQNFRKCVIDAAKITRDGKNVERGLSSLTLLPLLDHDGSGDPDEMAVDLAFRDCRSVKVGQARVLRTRPRFNRWSVTYQAMIFTNVIGSDDVIEFVKLAGRSIGLGDNRTNGFGRFDLVEVKEF